MVINNLLVTNERARTVFGELLLEIDQRVRFLSNYDLLCKLQGELILLILFLK